MPSIYELPKSRRGRQDAASGALTREWFVGGSNDVSEVRDLLLANNPVYYLGLARKSVQWDSLGAPDLWVGVVEYGVSALPDGLKPDELSFKITAGTVHVTQSKETKYRLTAADTADAFASGKGSNLTVDGADNTLVAPDGYTPTAVDVGKTVTLTGSPAPWVILSYTITAVGGGKWKLSASPAPVGTGGGIWQLALPAGFIGTAPDQGGAIGVTLDSVQGVDIFVPKMEWSLSRQRSIVDFPYLRTLRSLVGKTNDAIFYGFAAGTLLYMGCEPTSSIGTLDDGSKFLFWNLCHSFAQEENRLNLSVGPVTIPQKAGWEYVWAKYAPNTNTGQLVQKPIGVYVERMYEPGNFELLEIGS